MTKKFIRFSTILFILSMLALVSLVGVIYFYKQRADTILKREIAMQKSVRIFYEAELAFHIQVQDWKDILLRGANPEDKKKYYEAFLKRSQEFTHKLTELQHLLNTFYATSDTIFSQLRQIEQLHDIINQSYFRSLKILEHNKFNDIFYVDQSIKGVDRPLQQVLAELRKEFLDRLLIIKAQNREQLQDFTLVIILVLSLILIFGFFIYFAYKKAKDLNAIFTQTLDTINQGLLIVKGEQIVLASQRYTQIIGEKLEGKKFQNLYSHVYKKDKNRLKKEHFLAFKEKKSAFTCTYRVVEKDGALIWVRDDVHFTYDTFGKIDTVFVVASDITQKKLRQCEIENSHQRYRALSAASSHILFIKDIDLHYFVVNKNFIDFFQKEEHDILDKTDYDIIDYSNAKLMRADDKHALESPVQTKSTMQIAGVSYEITRYKLNLGDQIYLVGSMQEII